MSGISLAPSETSLFRIVQAITSLGRGASNAVGTVTLRIGQTTTIVDKTLSPAAENVSNGMQIFLQAKTANAASIIASVYISAIGQKTFTIEHPAPGAADYTYAWEARG